MAGDLVVLRRAYGLKLSKTLNIDRLDKGRRAGDGSHGLGEHGNGSDGMDTS
jgi:hypothetical protein